MIRIGVNVTHIVANAVNFECLLTRTNLLSIQLAILILVSYMKQCKCYKQSFRWIFSKDFAKLEKQLLLIVHLVNSYIQPRKFK